MGVVLNDDYHYSSLPGRPLDLLPLGQTGLTDASMNNNNIDITSIQESDSDHGHGLTHALS